MEVTSGLLFPWLEGSFYVSDLEAPMCSEWEFPSLRPRSSYLYGMAAIYLWLWSEAPMFDE
jgi:hypothetical protein